MRALIVWIDVWNCASIAGFTHPMTSTIIFGSLPNRFCGIFKQSCHVAHLNGPLIHPRRFAQEVVVKSGCRRTYKTTCYQTFDDLVGRLNGILDVVGGSFQILSSIL